MRSDRPILLFGKNGQLGRELRAELSHLGAVSAVGRGEADLTDVSNLQMFIRAANPALIVNAAAYTAVDLAEQDAVSAFAINARAPSLMAEVACSLDIPLLHFSTDYVFDGESDRPYTEKDVPNPLSVYGHSKLAGEVGVQDSGAAHLIFRLSWVYALHGNNFLRTVLRLAAAGTPLRVVSDQVGSPTWSRSVASAVGKLLLAVRTPAGNYGALQDVTGLYHLTAGDPVSWYEFACAIVQQFAPSLRETPPVQAISTEEYPTPARRPRNSLLCSDLAEERLNVRLPPWREQLASAAISAPAGS